MFKLAIFSATALCLLMSGARADNDLDFYAGLTPEQIAKIDLNHVKPISTIGINGTKALEEKGVDFLAQYAKPLGLKVIVMRGVEDCDKVEIAGLRCDDIRHADKKDADKMEKAFNGLIPTLEEIGLQASTH